MQQNGYIPDTANAIAQYFNKASLPSQQETLGEIVIADANGQNPRVLTGPGHFGNLAFSPDGTMIAFEKREGGYLTSPDFSEAPGIYVMSLGGGEPRLVTRDGANPQWGAASDRLFMLGREGGGLAGMVGLRGPLRHDHIGTLGLRLGHQEFQLACLVAAR